MDSLREYIVTLKKFEDLESFYDDMETPGGDLYIPNRQVNVLLRRPTSRNTHYMLSLSEAEQLKLDPRVEGVELNLNDLGIKVTPFEAVQSSNNWSKSSTASSNNKNWGLLRSVEGTQRSNWGSDGTSNQSGSITLSTTGKNVDVVIIDGNFYPNHPEFLVNPDGTGGSRVVDYNWFQHTNIVTGGTNGTYDYTVNLNEDDDHGAHVAGTVAGNTQGWARSANIYRINPYSTASSPISISYLFDYVRYWHNNKPINSQTGYRNPTVLNCSFGISYVGEVANITEVVYRGVVTTENINGSFLSNCGVYNNGVYYAVDYRSTAIDADVQDCINDGIIVVAAAGNWSTVIDTENGSDYNNYIATNIGGFLFSRGTSPGASAGNSGSICVGAIDDTVTEQKGDYSSRGPRIDVFAPGTSIISSVNYNGVPDPRNSSFYIGVKTGTSMASPQVAGVIASLLEIYPRWKQSDARNYLLKKSTTNQISDTGGSVADLYSLRGSPNRYLYYVNERPTLGSAWPKVNYNFRPNLGVAYPRFTRKIR